MISQIKTPLVEFGEATLAALTTSKDRVTEIHEELRGVRVVIDAIAKLNEEVRFKALAPMLDAHRCDVVTESENLEHDTARDFEAMVDELINDSIQRFPLWQQRLVLKSWRQCFVKSVAKIDRAQKKLKGKR